MLQRTILAAALAVLFVHSTRSETSSAEAKKAPTARKDEFGAVLPHGAIARLGSESFRTPTEHSCGIVFSPDGKLLASSTHNQIIHWDAATGNSLRTVNCPKRFCDTVICEMLTNTSKSPRRRPTPAAIVSSPARWS